jgi:hypothetical protein
MRAWLAAHRRVFAVLVILTIIGGSLRAIEAANPSRYQSVDERAYGRLARNLARKNWYGAVEMADPYHWPPGAPMLFGLAHKIRPAYDPVERWDVPSAYPVQAVVGTALIPAVFVLALLLAGPVAALVAAGAVAAYPPLITATGDLLTEPLGALLVTCALIAVVLALRRPTWRRGLAAGLLLGATVLVRGDLILAPLLLVGLVALLAWRADGRRPALRTAGAMLAGTLLLVAPWSAYASSKRGHFVPVSTGGASNLYVGTYLPGDGTIFGLKRAWADETRRLHPDEFATPVQRLPQTKVLDAVADARPERDREAALRAAALENIEEYALGQPLDYLGMMARKVERLWLRHTTGSRGVGQRPPILAFHLVLVILGLGGLIAGLLARRDRTLWPLAVVLGYVTLTNVVLVSEPRHNLPLMPLVVVGGVAGGLLAATRLKEWNTATSAPRPAPSSARS